MSTRLPNKIANSPLDKISVLLVDDDRRLLRLVKNVLLSFGFKDVVSAQNGQEAIKLLQFNKFDLVITSWQMDPVSGYDLVYYIRNDPASPDFFVPVIMLSGMAEKHHIEQARDVGITEFLAKPFSVQDFKKRIICVFESPREFIFSATYSGPNRRRHSSVRSPTTERRRDN